MMAVYGALGLNLIALLFAACMTLADAIARTFPQEVEEHDPAVLQV
jgi:starvation-inducible outer membrane lipoprotein